MRSSPPAPPEIAPEKTEGFAEGGSAFGGLLIGLGVAALVLTGDHSGVFSSETMQGVAIAALACLPGLLCLMARRSRPSLYLAGGMIGGSLPLLLASVVGVGFWIPAGLALVAYGRQSGKAQGRLADPVVALICFVLAWGAFAALFVHQDPACSFRANSSYCTSDYVTPIEGLVSVAVTSLAFVSGWVLARPRDHAR